MIRVWAPAKINLVLEVLGKRADNYHEIRSLVQTVSLYDEMVFQDSPGLEVHVSDPALKIGDNLVMKAAESLRKATGCKLGAKISLTKHIPLSAGLGGGSSNAAATLVTLNRLWRLNLTHMHLADIAARLGSDVPLFLEQGSVLLEGRGEKVSRVNFTGEVWYLLLVLDLPEKQGKTRVLYGMLDKQHYGSGERTILAMAKLEEGSGIDASLLYNVFDDVAFAAYEGLEKCRDAFRKAGAANVHLCGAGPTLFTILENAQEAGSMRENLGKQGYSTFLVVTANGIILKAE